MSYVVPWSYSSLTGFETCPFKFYEVRIAKTTKAKPFKEAAEGTKKHSDIELYLKGEKGLEDTSLQSLVDRTLAGLDYAHLKFEHKLAITKDLKPTDFFAKDCYHRGVLDVQYVHPEESVAKLFDWKNGKINAYSKQLVANAITVFVHNPHVERVDYSYVWMKHDEVTDGRVYRQHFMKDWNKFVERVEKMEQALINNYWPKCPSGLCKKHCEVTTCEHNGSYQNA